MLAYTVLVGVLALLLVFVTYCRKLIGLRAEPEPPRRRLSAEEVKAMLHTLESFGTTPSTGVRVTFAGSDEEVFAKLAAEGRILLIREAWDV